MGQAGKIVCHICQMLLKSSSEVVKFLMACATVTGDAFVSFLARGLSMAAGDMN